MSEANASSPSPASPPPASLKGLSNRLKIKTNMVRKIAIMDLIKRHEELGTSEVADVLAAHLLKESQPALQLRVIDFLATSRCAQTIPMLERLTENASLDDAVQLAATTAMESLREKA